MVTTHEPRSGRRLLPLLPILVLSTGFGAVSGTVVDASLGFAVFGLLWGAAVVTLAPGVVRAGARSRTWADTPVAVAAGLALVVVGGSAYAELKNSSPQVTIGLLQQSSSHWFFPILHVLFEWVLLPTVLMLNWTHRTRRNLLLVAAAVFYLCRISSALYFAPHALDWAQLPAGTLLNAETLRAVELWTMLDRLRFAVQDVLVAGLLLLAQYRQDASR